MPDSPPTPPPSETPPETSPEAPEAKGKQGQEAPETEHSDDKAFIALKNEAKAAKRRATEAEAKLALIDEANKSELDKALEGARKEARAGADEEWSGKLLHERVRALAAVNFADPVDAVQLLDLSALTYDDEAGILEALADLLKTKPYLARTQAGAGTGRYPLDQGSRNDGLPGKAPSSMNDWIRAKAKEKR